MSGCQPLVDRGNIHLLTYADDIKEDPDVIDIRPRQPRQVNGLRYIQRFSRNPVIHNGFHREAIR